MAEEVQISNVGGDGVASEVTLQRLVTAMEAMAKQSGIDSKSQALKLQKLYNQEVDKSKKATAEQTDATTEQTTATKKATDETNKFARSLGGAVAAGIGALTSSALGLGKAFWNNTTSVEEFASLLPGLGSLLAPLGAYVDESVGSFRSLSASGAAFGGSITNMRNAAAGMEISLSEMTRLFTEQAPALASLGGTVEEGAARFAKMNKNIKATGDFRSLMEMGFSVEEVNEGMADYIALQARQGRLQGQSTEELAAGSARYLKQIDLLARVTGKTREQAQAAIDAQAADSVARTLLNQFDKNSADGQRRYDNLTASLALLDEVGGASAEALKGMLTENLTPAAGKFMAMLGDSGDTVHAAMMEVGKGADPQVLLNAFRTAGGELERFAGADAAGRVAMIQALREAGDPMADYLDGAAKLIELGNRDMAAAQAQQAAQRAQQDEASRAMLTFEQNQRELSAALHKTFVASGILDLIGSGLTAMGTLLTGITTSLNEFATKVANGGWFDAITGLLGDALGGLWNNAGIVAAIVGGITALFAAKAATSAVSNAATGFFTRLFTGGRDTAPTTTPTAPTRGGRGNAGGIGKSIGDFGKGLGKGFGGILMGLANGLKAFANPAVPVGALALGAAIVAIGAGIAGATWIMGKALPSFAEGMQSFENLDGGKLIDAGAGIAAVAAGMAAFGVGSAVSGLGSLVGAVTQSIAGLFGAEDPLEKIKKFQEYNFDAGRIENNASAIVSYSKGMAALGAAEGIGGIGAAVGAIGGAIAELFGADDPLTKMYQFQAYSFDRQKIEENARAVSAYASAMKDFPTSPAPSIFGSFATGVAKLFGVEADPMAPIKRFGEMTLNTANIIANAGAVAAYAVAMKDFPASPSASVFSAFKAGLLGLFGVEADPFAPIKALGEMNLNTANIIANAGAVSAYAEAMKDFPASPSASVFSAFKAGLLGLFGVDSDPFSPMRAFGDLSFNTAGIIANAGAVAAYAVAMKDFPASPSASVFTAFKAGLLGLFGVDSDPFAPMRAFGDLSFNTAGIIANAGAVAAYAEAMKDFPASPSASVFTAFKEGLFSLFGANSDPFAPMKAFGDMTFNTAGIVTNSEAVKNFSLAMKDFAQSDISSVDIPSNLASRLTGLNEVPHQNFQSLANGLNALGSVQGLQSNLDILKNSLDADGVRRYATAIEDLVEKLEDLNSELTKDNNGRFTAGTGTNAGSVLGQASATTGLGDGTQQLNTTLQQILMILTEMRDINEDIEENTGNMVGSNIAQGGVSVLPR